MKESFKREDQSTKKRAVRRRDNAQRLKNRDFIFLAVFAAFAAVVATQWILAEALNPLSPNIHIQILQTDLYTFPLRIS